MIEIKCNIHDAMFDIVSKSNRFDVLWIYNHLMWPYVSRTQENQRLRSAVPCRWVCVSVAYVNDA